MKICEACKNCINFDNCALIIGFCDRDILENGLPDCKLFKYKSKFIELPCFVGDYVWIIGKQYDDSPYEIAMSKVYKIQLKKDKTLLFTFSWNFEHGLRHSGNFSINTLGKKWFLTREEAEKKLEELNA